MSPDRLSVGPERLSAHGGPVTFSLTSRPATLTVISNYRSTSTMVFRAKVD